MAHRLARSLDRAPLFRGLTFDSSALPPRRLDVDDAIR